MNVINIERDALRAMLHLAAKNDVRFYLNGILVEANAGTTRLVATDGTVLGVYQHKAPEGNPNAVEGVARVIVPREVVERIKPDRNALTFVQITWSDEKMRDAELNDTGTRFPFLPVDARFPEYARTLPTGAMSGKAAQVDAELVSQFVKVHKTLGQKNCPGSVRLEYDGQERPVRVTLPSFPGFAGVLMPLRMKPGEIFHDITWASRSLQPADATAEAA